MASVDDSCRGNHKQCEVVMEAIQDVGQQLWALQENTASANEQKVKVKETDEGLAVDTGDTVSISLEAKEKLVTETAQYDSESSDDPVAESGLGAQAALVIKGGGEGGKNDSTTKTASATAASGASTKTSGSSAKGSESSDETSKSSGEAAGGATSGSSTSKSEIEDLENEIDDLKTEIEDLETKANRDEEASKSLKSKRVELATLEAELAYLEQQQG